MARIVFLAATPANLLAAIALKARAPARAIAVVDQGADAALAVVLDGGSLSALDGMAPGSGSTLRRAASQFTALTVERGGESMVLEGGELSAIAGNRLDSILRQQAQVAGVAFVSAVGEGDIPLSAPAMVKGYVEQPVAQASSDYRFAFADAGHNRSIGLGDAAVLRRYGDRAETSFDVADLPSMVAFAQDAVEACAGDEAGAAQRLEQANQARALANQHGARNLADWFSHAGRYRHLPLAQFAYSMLSASQRVGHEELVRQFPSLVRQVETGLAGNDPMPPMFAPFALRGLTMVNRVVVSPMCMYSASEGMPDDFHLVHLGSRALGGAGLVISEMTAVSQEGRITPGCAGIYTDAQAAAWQRIVAFVHRASSARIGLQLGHAGPKASTQLGWQRMDAPLKEGNWPIVAASDLAYGPDNQIPKPLDEADMARIEQAYVHAARRAIGCGFDMLELHAAHGYLLSSFISPLTNRRADQYGGSLDNRLRFPLRVFGAIRKAWPQDKPITVRISAHDWAEGGTTGDDAMAIAAAFKAAGADAISVSTGQTTRQAKPLYGRMYQVPFADRIRNEVGIPTIAVGAITDADQVNSIIAAGRADLCALARPHLADPHWTLHAAVDQGVKQQAWPKQYIAGRFQAERELGKRARPGAGA